MFRLFLFFVFIATAETACSNKWPNGTDTMFHWWQCDNGPIKVYNATTQDANGKFEYPIHLNAILTILADIDDPSYTLTEPNLRVSANLWAWGEFGCGWTTIPTLGLTNNLNACAYGVPCPIYPGRQWLTLKINPAPFQPIINMLTDDAAYQIQILLHDNASGVDMCLIAQARCLIH